MGAAFHHGDGIVTPPPKMSGWLNEMVIPSFWTARLMEARMRVGLYQL